MDPLAESSLISPTPTVGRPTLHLIFGIVFFNMEREEESLISAAAALSINFESRTLRPQVMDESISAEEAQRKIIHASC